MSGVTMQHTYSVNPADYLSSTGGVTGTVGLPGSSAASGNSGGVDTQQLMMEILQEILQILSQSMQSPGSDDASSSPQTPAMPSTPSTPMTGGGSAGAIGGGSSGSAPVSGGAGMTPGGITSTSGPAATGGAPGTVDLSGFGDLQLPSGSAGNVDTVGAGQLGSYNSQYFQHNSNGSITMTVPEGGGVHTANSNFPRTELEESGSWKMSSGTSTLSATLSVDKLPSNGDIVIGQIHQRVSSGKPRPPVELHYDNGNIVASVMDSNSPSAGRHNVTIATGVKPGQKFSYSMQMQPNGQLNISADGQSKSVQMDPSFNSSNLYFKMGNYCQDDSGGSVVTFDGDSISHTQ